MPAPVFYSISMFGTGTVETGAGNITITNGVAVLSVEQTGNIGVGVEIEYNSIKCYIAPNRIGFDAGSTEIKVGDKITDATSAATGIVRFVEVTGGTWGGNNAAGWIYFEKTTGTFGNNNVINITKPTVTNSVAVVNGTIEGNIGNGNTNFVVKSAVGADAANQAETAVTSIHHVWASLSAFEGAFTGANYINSTNLTTADVVAHACCYYDHADYTLDTSTTTVQGTTMDATRYLMIFAPRQGAESINKQRHEGAWNANKYMLDNSAGASSTQINTRDEKVVVEGLQLELRNSTSSIGFRISSNEYVNTFIIKDCIILGQNTNGDCFDFGTSPGASGGGDSIITIINCIGYNCKRFVYMHDADNEVSIFHCTTDDCSVNGILHTAGTVTVKNTVVFNGADDFSGTIACDYCASDDANASTYTNGEDFTAEATDWNKVFTDYSTYDYTLKNYTTNPCCVGEGTNLAASEGIWRDIAGNERGATPDIGAFEYVAAGGNVDVAATCDALVLTEYSATVNAEINVEAGVDALVITENVANVNLDVSVSTDVDALVLTEYYTTVNAEISFTTGVDTLILTEHVADVNLDVNVSGGVDALILTEHIATVNAEISFTTIVDDLILTGHSATVNAGVNVSTNVDALILTEYSVTINAETSFTAGVDNLILTEYGASIAAGTLILAGVDNLFLTEYGVVVNAEMMIAVGVDNLILSEYAAAVAVGGAYTRRGSSGFGFSFRDGWR